MLYLVLTIRMPLKKVEYMHVVSEKQLERIGEQMNMTLLPEPTIITRNVSRICIAKSY